MLSSFEKPRVTKAPNALRFALSMLLVLCCPAFVLRAGAADKSIASAPEKLSQIENAITGENNSRLAIEKRIRQLELKVFAGVQKGSLANRISALEKFAGLSSEDSMPPLPPPITKARQDIANKAKITQTKDLHANEIHANEIQKKPNQTKELSSKPKHASTKASPQNLEHKLEQAVKLHHEGRVVEAEESLQEILKESPKTADAYFSLGAIAETRGDYQTALGFYQTAVQINPFDSEAQQAITELSKRIANATSAGPFVNPLSPPPQAPPNVLQGSALELTAATGMGVTNGRYRGHAPLSLSAAQSNQQMPSTAVPTNSSSQLRSRTVARTLARAALGAALSGSGLHCPMCQLMRGF